MKARRSLLAVSSALLATLCALATGCFQELDPEAASGGGVGEGGEDVTESPAGLNNWQLCQSPSCDEVSGDIPFLTQTPPIYLPDGGTTTTPCDDVEQASMAIRQTYCAACHQSPANQAGLDCVLDDQQLVGRPSQTALTDAGTPQLLAIAGNPADSWLYVRVAQGLGGVQGGMPPLTMAGYPTIPRPTASDLSVLYGWLLACFPGADGGGYVVGGGSYAPAPGSDDAGVEAGEGEGGGGD
jgi:hypothetical protein